MLKKSYGHSCEDDTPRKDVLKDKTSGDGSDGCSTKLEGKSARGQKGG